MVCEYGSKGTIMVYDRELWYVRCIQHEGIGQIMDVSADSHGNLYVTRGSKSSVVIVSSCTPLAATQETE